MPELDFTIGVPREEGLDPFADPIRFEVNGHVFEALREAPGGQVYDMVASASNPDQVQAAATAASSTLHFLRTVLAPESYERFDTLFHSVDDPITPDQVNLVVNGLCEVYGKRPTARAGRSSPGRPRTGTNSTGAFRSAGSTPEPSASTGS